MSLHVEVHGSGRDLVLLHGWGMHGGAWAEVIPRLSSRHRLHVLDLPGHGRSAAIVPADFEEAVGVVARHVPEGAALCGWSLGGLFAQRLAQRAPDVLGCMVLVSTTPSFVQRAGWDEAMRPETLQHFADGLQRDRAATLRGFVQLNALNGARGREAIRAFTARLAEHGTPPLAALEASLAWLRQVDLRAAVADIACPTLVVHGTRDALAPVGAGRWLAHHIRAARLLEIADAGHLPFFSHGDAFAAGVEDFLG